MTRYLPSVVTSDSSIGQIVVTYTGQEETVITLECDGSWNAMHMHSEGYGTFLQSLPDQTLQIVKLNNIMPSKAGRLFLLNFPNTILTLEW